MYNVYSHNPQDIGGLVQKGNTGEHLQEFLRTEMWWDHFAPLSESLGFSLSIYSPSGMTFFPSSCAVSPCPGFWSPTSDFLSKCETHCRPLILNTLSTGKPDIFTCYAKIVHFALPIEYLGEKIVIMGSGSFSSYKDFRTYMDIMQGAGLDTISLNAPLSFSSSEQAWKACDILSKSIYEIFTNRQEAVKLRKKIESLKKTIGMWGADGEKRPELLYKAMISNLSSLLELENIAVLVPDRRRGGYTSLYALSRSNGTPEVVSIAERHSVVQELSKGKEYVLSAEPVQDPNADFLNGMGALYFFPVMVGKKLEAVIRIDDRGITEGDRQIVTAFCRQTALLIENRRLHQDLYEKFYQFATISSLTRSITPIQDYETLLRTILDLSADLLKAEQGSLMLIDHETDALLLEAKKGIVDGVTEKFRINRGEGIAGRVAEMGEPLLVENLEQDPRIRQSNRAHYKTRSFVSVPLKIDDRIIGVLNLSDKTTGEVFNKEDLDLIQSFATHAAIVMERNVILNKTEELKKMTITDSLTGLLNRRYLFERLKDELARSARHGHNFSLLMLDVDGFKCCNDTLGHPIGDKTLKTIADVLMNTVRSIDIVARCGGDEFMVILPETGEVLAVEIAERVRKQVEKEAALSEARLCTITTSVGIVSYPKHGESVEKLLENVDKALYRAKNKGKNRIEVFS